jgi:hypothetical protein
MRRLFQTLTVFAAVLLSGIVQGVWSDRWAVADGPKEAAAKFARVPLTMGEWDGQDQAVDDRTLTAAQASGVMSRRFVNRRTGNVLTVLIVCGRPGPVSVHTPDICYRGAGYEELGQRRLHVLRSEGTPEFWVSDFQKRDGAVPTYMRIFYSWSGTGAWRAPTNPRLAFARNSSLFKLYVVRQLSKPEESIEDDPTPEFLNLLLPELERCLFSQG